MLRKPIPTKYNNKDKIQAFNSYSGDPYSWFDTEYFRNAGLHPISFDFIATAITPTATIEQNSSFEDFKDGEKLSNFKIDNNIYIKRTIYNKKSYLNKNENEIYESIIKCDTEEYVLLIYEFSKKHNLNLNYLIIPELDIKEWEIVDKNNEKNIILFSISNYINKSEPVVQYFSVEELNQYIKKIKNTSFKVKKPFEYPPTTLEYYLSSSKEECWALDADVLLINDNYEVQCIIEIKKETNNSKINIIDESPLNYIERDFKKYNALYCLKKYFNTKLYVLYFYADEDKDNMNEKKSDKHKENRIIKIIDLGKHFEDYYLYFDIINEKIYPLPNINYPEDLKQFFINFRSFFKENRVIIPKTCPYCHSPLIVKINKQNNSKFYGCSQYPKCGHSEKY